MSHLPRSTHACAALSAGIGWLLRPSAGDAIAGRLHQCAIGLRAPESFNVAKALDIPRASNPTTRTFRTWRVINPASIDFVRTGASFSLTNEWPLKIGTTIALTGQYSAVPLATFERMSFAQGHQPCEASGDSDWERCSQATVRSRRASRIGAHSRPMFRSTRRVSVCMRVPLRRRGLRCTAWILQWPKAIGDASLEGASRSPRINATFSYQLNRCVRRGVLIRGSTIKRRTRFHVFCANTLDRRRASRESRVASGKSIPLKQKPKRHIRHHGGE